MYQEITIQFTTHCTLQCPYCFAPKEEVHCISAEDFQYFEKFCEINKPDCIHITGGEPSLHPDFAGMVSCLSRKTSLVIYSNLTVPNVVEAIHTEHPEEIVFLANLNERYSYDRLQWEAFEQNIHKIKEKGMRLAIGHTFYIEPFEDTLKYVISYIRRHQIDHFRISQAMQSKHGAQGLDCRQIRKLYHIVANDIDEWEKLGIRTYFDCPVPPCYIEKDIFSQLRKKDAVGIECKEKAFVMWDLSVTHCYSTIGFGDRHYLREFQSIQDMKEYSKELLKYRKNGLKEEKCTGCIYEGQRCGCPDYYNEQLPKCNEREAYEV
ncbi:MAG: hypothetical protein NC548_28930 [Lachnospiraceae bacterium]|nr:hypothetical protein [Lachnospiraceae bacterium]